MSEDRIFYSFGTQIGIIERGHVLGIGGRGRESRILRNGIARLGDGSLVFGEYLDNRERGAVEIFRLSPTGSAPEVVFRFSPGEVRHVHSVNWDPYASRLVVATGDVGHECRLLSFSHDFSERDVLGEGSESWRTISPQFSEDSIFFGTDAQFQQNVIRRLDRATGQVDDLVQVNGPVFYSAPIAGGWVFGTAAELCESQTSPEAVLHHVDSASSETSILDRFAKDRLSTKYFQFGLLSFPTVERPIDVLPVSGTALKGLDGRFTVVTRR